MQSTGQTSTHCEIVWCPTHSVHSAEFMTKISSPCEIAALGHSDSHTSQLIHSSVIIKAISTSTINYVWDLVRSCAATRGCTNFSTFPPSRAISRTMEAEMNIYCSDGVMKTVSTLG